MPRAKFFDAGDGPNSDVLFVQAANAGSPRFVSLEHQPDVTGTSQLENPPLATPSERLKWFRADSGHHQSAFESTRRPWIMRPYGEHFDSGDEDRLAALRRQIADGTYDTPERLAAAVSMMFDQEFADEAADARPGDGP